MIDALAAVLAFLAADAGLAAATGGRIAAKHKFGLSGGWPTPAKALTVVPAPGPAGDGWQTPRLEARCYGASQAEAGTVYRALLAAVETAQRVVVTTPDGQALLYFLVLDTTPGLFIDPDVHVDFLLCYLRAAVSADALP